MGPPAAMAGVEPRLRGRDGGSVAYGCGVEKSEAGGSDLDLVGVAIAAKQRVFPHLGRAHPGLQDGAPDLLRPVAANTTSRTRKGALCAHIVREPVMTWGRRRRGARLGGAKARKSRRDAVGPSRRDGVRGRRGGERAC